MINTIFKDRWKQGYELEANIINDVNIITFNNTMSYMLYLNNNNLIHHDEVLDINLDSGLRLSIEGLENISTYCKSTYIDSVPYKCIQKKKIFVQDLVDLNTRVRLSSENQVELNETISNKEKHFRLKKRVSITTADNQYRYDFTIIKQYNGINLRDARRYIERREIEMEYIGHDKPNLDNFTDKMNILLKAYYDDPLLTPLSKKKEVIHDYITICKTILPSNTDVNNALSYIQKNFTNQKQQSHFPLKSFLIGPKPITLERNQISNILSNYNKYNVTIKADGDRVLVFVNKNREAYMINFNLDVKYLGRTKKELVPNTVYDGELVKTHDQEYQIMLFDCYIYDSIDITKEDLENRLKNCIAFSTSKYNVFVKKFYNVEEAKNILYSKYSYDTDGLIFTPTTEVQAIGTWESCYKWKPPELNTIDFLVSFVKDEKGNIIEFVSKEEDRYYVLNAFVGSVPITPSSYFKASGKRYVALSFVTDGHKVHTVHVNCNKTCDNGDIIEDNYVVECYYDLKKGFWRPHRVRFDKTWDAILNKTITGNNIKSAFNIWNTIIDPIEVDDLLNGSGDKKKPQMTLTDKYYDRKSKNTMLQTMNRIHNKTIKNDFTFKKLAEAGNMTIFDVACGKCGDLHKWIDNKFHTVIGVDIFEDNIINPFDGAYKRLSESKIPSNYKYIFLPMDSSISYHSSTQLKNIRDKYTQELAQCALGKKGVYQMELQKFNGIIKKKVDVVSCQFALHYFFESEKKVEGLMQNVSEVLKNGGFFVGTCFDGDSIYNLLHKNDDDKIEVTINHKKVWSIQNMSKTKKTFGHKISVFIDSINKEHEEYLVFFDKFVKHIEKFGLRQLNATELKKLNLEKSSYMFEEIIKENTMKQYEAQLSFLNRWFIFVKDDQLLKKTSGLSRKDSS